MSNSQQPHIKSHIYLSYFDSFSKNWLTMLRYPLTLNIFLLVFETLQWTILFLKTILLINLILTLWIFAAQVYSLVVASWAYSLTYDAQASHCGGFSCCGAEAPGGAGFSSCGTGIQYLRVQDARPEAL